MAQSRPSLINALWDNWNSRGLISPMGKSASSNPELQLCHLCTEAKFSFMGPRIEFESPILECSLAGGSGSEIPNGKNAPRLAPASTRIETAGTATKPSTSCHKKHPKTGQNRRKKDEVSP